MIETLSYTNSDPEEQREREDAFEIYIEEMSDPNDPDHDYDMFSQDKPEDNTSATPQEYNE